MKKELTIAASILLFSATPVLAHANHTNNGNENGNVAHAQFMHQNNDEQNENETQAITGTPQQTVTPSVTPCDPSENWKNHGAYVSCVAHLHQATDIDDAARSEIGKQNQSTPTPTISVSTVPTQTVTPSVTVTVTPTTTPTVSISPTQTASTSPTPGTTDIDFSKTPFYKSNFENVFSTFVTFMLHLL